MPPTKKSAAAKVKKNRKLQAMKKASNMGANFTAMDRAAVKAGMSSTKKKKKATKRRK